MTPKCYSYIRFSTPEQLKGDSLRRQLKMSEDYAREHGLELDPMRDLGLSAFKGVHRSRGALGGFLTLVEAGKIPKGSTLLVESLDRLSREQVLDALEQFLSIVRAGVKVVTLGDRMEYTRESINANIGQLMFSLTIMSRAHEESLTKAKRIKAAWEQKRNMIGEQKLTSRAPEWLELTPDRTAFRPIPERAEIIVRIYREKLAGRGAGLIARDLNQQTAWTPKNGWRKSYVEKILRTSAVIGEYQPHKMTVDADGNYKRVPIGEPIPDYFPKVVPEESFYAVRQQMEQRASLNAGNGGGRNGKISNLFGHIAKCGYCGGSMSFVDKGKPPKGGSYLICDNARRGLPNCKRRPIRYDEFENLVLTFCRGLNPADLLPGRDERESKLQVLKGRLATVNGKAKEATAKVNNLTDSIATTGNVAVRRTLEGRLAEALKEQEIHETEARQLNQEIKRHSRSKDEVRARLESMQELLSFLQERDGDELIDVRCRLREELRSLIEWIDVRPVGQLPMTEELAERMLKAALDVHSDMSKKEQKELEADLAARIENRDFRDYVIHFKGGSICTIVPTTPHKLALDFDKEGGRVRSQYQGIDGKTVTIEVAS